MTDLREKIADICRGQKVGPAGALARADAILALFEDTIKDEIKAITKQRDIAVWMLAEWCVAIERNGTGWDDWDEHYKDAMYRDGPLRALLDAAIDEARL